MLQPLMANGTTTYALNVQLPLQTVDMINGPTSLCPATHSEVFCKRGLTLSSAYLALYTATL